MTYSFSIVSPVRKKSNDFLGLLHFIMTLPLLSKGQTIGIIVPARKADKELVLKGCDVIRSWGLQVELGKHCFEEGNHYLAAPDEDRLSDLQFMLDSPNINAIFCARGGYGTTRILDQLDFTTFIKHPKWIVGFSDITALHLKLYQLGIESIHGCMPVQFAKPEYEQSVISLQEILFSDNEQKIKVKKSDFNRLGTGTGRIIGGNLSLVVDSLGTETELESTGNILVLEEIDEPLYKIDRMLTQLKRAGKFSQLTGLVIGHMTDIKDTVLPFNQTLEAMILDKVAGYNFPVAFGFPIGHEAPNLAWRHSAKATLSVTPQQSILEF